MKQSHKTIALWIILTAAFCAAYGIMNDSKGSSQWVRFSDLLDDVESEKLESVQVTLKNGGFSGTFRAKLRAGQTVQSDGVLSDAVLDRLREHRVDLRVHSERDDSLWSYLGPLFSLLSVVAIVFFLMTLRNSRNTAPGVDVYKKARVQITLADAHSVRFADLRGLESQKAALLTAARELRQDTKHAEGWLLHGPPGCGKTQLARALAGEAKLPLLATSGADFLEMWVGIGAARVRDLFAQAAQKAPCIVFIDDIDSIARAREKQHSGLHTDEREQTLHALLSVLDGVNDRPAGVLVIAASNRIDLIDPALLRPGRLGNQLELQPAMAST